MREVNQVLNREEVSSTKNIPAKVKDEYSTRSFDRFCSNTEIDVHFAGVKDEKSGDEKDATSTQNISPKVRDKSTTKANDGRKSTSPEKSCSQLPAKKWAMASNEQQPQLDNSLISQHSHPQTLKKEEEIEEEDFIECLGIIPASSSAPNNSANRKLRDSDVVCVHGETTLEHPGNVAY